MKMTETGLFFTLNFWKVTTLTGFFYWYFDWSDLGLKQSGHINRIIPLTVIKLSGLFCFTFLKWIVQAWASRLIGEK